MATFRIGFSEDKYGFYYFTAENAEKAQRLIDLIDEGDLDIADLPDFYEKVNGGGHEWISKLEEAN